MRIDGPSTTAPASPSARPTPPKATPQPTRPHFRDGFDPDLGPASDPLKAAQALAKQTGATTPALASAYEALVNAMASGEVPAAAARPVLTTLIDQLVRNAADDADGWDHASRTRLDGDAAAAKARLQKTVDPDALALPLSLAPLSAPEEAQAMRLEGLMQAQTKASALWAAEPADQLDVTVKPGAKPTDTVKAWETALGKAAGAGDRGALKNDLENNHAGLEMLANIYGNTKNVSLYGDVAHRGVDSNVWKSQLYGSVMQTLQLEHPNAVFELGVARQGSLKPDIIDPMRQDPDVVIAMTEVGADGKTNTTSFTLDTTGVNGLGAWGRIASSLKKNPDVAGAWVQAMNGLAASKNAPATGAKTVDDMIDALAGQQVPSGVVLDGIRQLDPDLQRKFFEGLGQSTDRIQFGGLLRKVDTPSTNDLLVAGDAAAIAHGDPLPEPFSTAVNVSGVPDLDKAYNFVDKNPDTLTPIFAQYTALRGDAPRSIASSTALANELGAAMNLQPNHMPKTAADQAAFSAGNWPFYEGDSLKMIQPAMGELSKQGFPLDVATLPIVFNSPQTGMVQLPLFRVTGKDGKQAFVDNTGRRYKDFADWHDNNKLPEGKMTYPAGGHLDADSNGKPRVETHNTPAVVDTPGKWLLRAGDTAALVGGVVLAGAAIIGTDGLAVPLVAAGISAWGLGRAAGTLYDLNSHDQSLGLDNPEARSAWVNLVANTVGLAALGASARVATAVSDFSAGRAVTATVVSRALGAAPNVLYGADLAANWNQMSDTQRMTAVSQLVFWGALNVKDIAHAGGVKQYFSAGDVKAQLQSAAARANAAGLETGAGDRGPKAVDPVNNRRVGLRSRFAAGDVDGSGLTGGATLRVPTTGDTYPAAGISGADPIQTSTGVSDCWLVASMSAVAHANPARIQSLIRGDAEHGWTVTGHKYSYDPSVKKQTWGPDTERSVTTLPLLPDGTPAFAKGNSGELWPAVLERAYLDRISNDMMAKPDSTGSKSDNYNNLAVGQAIKGTDPKSALEWLTGAKVDFSFILPGFRGSTFKKVYAAAQNGDAIVLGSYIGNQKPGQDIVPIHDYSVVGTSTDAAGNPVIIVRNPWDNSTVRIDQNAFGHKFMNVTIAHLHD